MPIIFKAKIPLWRRLMLLLLLCSGAFVIVATILRAYYSLKSITTLPVAAGWTSRETFVAAVAVSIPEIKPVFSRSRWFRFKSTGDDGYHSGTGAKSGGPHALMTIGGSRQPASYGDQEAQGDWKVRGVEIKGTRLSSDGGSEDIILSDHGPQSQSSTVHVTKDFKVVSEERITPHYG